MTSHELSPLCDLIILLTAKTAILRTVVEIKFILNIADSSFQRFDGLNLLSYRGNWISLIDTPAVKLPRLPRLWLLSSLRFISWLKVIVSYLKGTCSTTEIASGTWL